MPNKDKIDKRNKKNGKSVAPPELDFSNTHWCIKTVENGWVVTIRNGNEEKSRIFTTTASMLECVASAFDLTIAPPNG